MGHRGVRFAKNRLVGLGQSVEMPDQLGVGCFFVSADRGPNCCGANFRLARSETGCDGGEDGTVASTGQNVAGADISAASFGCCGLPGTVCPIERV